jgi:hypothetical protein
VLLDILKANSVTWCGERIDPEEATEPWPEAWVCNVWGGTNNTMEGTPLHWVFGNDACYQVSSTSGKTQHFCLCTGFEL